MTTYIFDGPSKAMEGIIPGRYTCMRILPSESGDPPVLLLGDDSGFLSAWQYEGGVYQLLASWPLTDAALDGFLVAAKDTIWAGSGGTLSILRRHHGPRPLWKSEPLGEVFGRWTVLLPDRQMFVTGGSYSLVGFAPR